jgi:hypothetical protein
MSRSIPLLSAVALAFLLGAAPEAEQPSDRYTLTPTEGGTFLRLDRQTGATSACRRKDGRLACETAADDRRALETEIDRLTTENAELKSAVKRLEDLLGLPDAEAKSPKHGTFNFKLPSEHDVDRAMDYVEGMVRKFKERWRGMKELGYRDYSNRWDEGDRWSYRGHWDDGYRRDTYRYRRDW